MSHTLNDVADSLTSFSEYRFRMKATNAYGDSDYSSELVAALAPLPSTPAAVTRDLTTSTKTSMNIQWAALGDTEPATGYQLYMTDVASSTTSLVYDGSSNPNVLSYLKTDLVTSNSYSFQLKAKNFNGYGSLSTAATFTACSAPSSQDPPTVSG